MLNNYHIAALLLPVETDRSMEFVFNIRKMEVAFQGTELYKCRNVNSNTSFVIKSLQGGTSDHFSRRINSTISSYSPQVFSYKRLWT